MTARVLMHAYGSRHESRADPGTQSDVPSGLVAIQGDGLSAHLARLAGIRETDANVVRFGPSMVLVTPATDQSVRRVEAFIQREAPGAAVDAKRQEPQITTRHDLLQQLHAAVGERTSNRSTENKQRHRTDSHRHIEALRRDEEHQQ